MKKFTYLLAVAAVCTACNSGNNVADKLAFIKQRLATPYIWKP